VSLPLVIAVSRWLRWPRGSWVDSGEPQNVGWAEYKAPRPRAASGVTPQRSERAGIAEGAFQSCLPTTGRPISVLNRWFALVADPRAGSLNTWAGYANDQCHLAESISTSAVCTLFAARGALRDAFAAPVRPSPGAGGPLGSRHLEPSSLVAAVDNFYTWAVEEELTTSLPFSYSSASYSWARNLYTGRPVRKNPGDGTKVPTSRHDSLAWRRAVRVAPQRRNARPAPLTQSAGSYKGVELKLIHR
jgi:hypothetical protein